MRKIWVQEKNTQPIKNLVAHISYQLLLKTRFPMNVVCASKTRMLCSIGALTLRRCRNKSPKPNRKAYRSVPIKKKKAKY